MSGAAFPQRLPPFIALAARGRLSEWGLRLCPKRLLIRRVLRSIVYDPEAGAEAEQDGGPKISPDVGLCSA